MAGMGPAPKTASARQRTNRVAGARTLSAVHDVAAPKLPAGQSWHRQTKAWWKDIWASPMAPEFEASDVHGLFLLAVLVDAFWVEPSKELAAEIRLQRQCFGLSPIDRRRLQWEIERAEEAESRTRKRRNDAVPRAEVGEADPRRLLA